MVEDKEEFDFDTLMHLGMIGVAGRCFYKLFQEGKLDDILKEKS